MSQIVNIAARLTESAASAPDRDAVVQPRGKHGDGSYRYEVWSFREFDDESDRLARGLVEMGVRPGMRMVLFVPFSSEFLALTFALFKSGATIVLIDPGMGRSNIFRCLEEVQPNGFVAIPIVHVARLAKRRLFPQARLNVTVGRRWFWGGRTYQQLSTSEGAFEIVRTQSTDQAAVIYTSGSTGTPKGVVYEHGMFDAQVDMIRDFYGIDPGEVDLPGFPLFGLFNAAMGVTTVIPDMDPTRPADVNPENIIQHISDWNVTQAFGSPAFWNRVGRHCDKHDVTFPTLRRGLSAGGPVPNHVLERMSRAMTRQGAELHTPYGATECLPVASISSHQVLHQTARQTRQGAGTCVGLPFPDVDVRIIEITDGRIASIEEATQLPAGEIGEIIVHSRSATREYDRNPEATGLAKIADHDQTFWHRMGDVGYLDQQGQLWFCGRKAHIVHTDHGRMFSVRCEAIFNEHPRVYRSALVALGDRPTQRPAMIIEPEAGEFPETSTDEAKFRQELREIAGDNELTASIEEILFHASLPVDTRHNVKINREQLAVWATERLSHRAE